MNFIDICGNDIKANSLWKRNANFFPRLEHSSLLLWFRRCDGIKYRLTASCFDFWTFLNLDETEKKKKKLCIDRGKNILSLKLNYT